MLPFDVQYFRPDSLREALSTYEELQADGLSPMYWAGGTEILTLGRTLEHETGAVVDIKSIPELQVHEVADGTIHLGAARTLAEVCDEDLFPLLTSVCGRIADHTGRCKITLGGDIAGSIPYREAALPFLLTASRARVADAGGVRETAFGDLFDGTLHLPAGAILVELNLPAADAQAPRFHHKATRLDWIDYPLVTIAGLRQGGRIRLAFSGLTATPLRPAAAEDALNGHGAPEARAQRALEAIEDPITEDIHGSAAWRRFVTAGLLTDMIADLEG